MREALIKKLESYTPFDQAEEQSVKRVIKLLNTHERCFWRDHILTDDEELNGHMTGSAILVDKTYRRILMTHHATLNKWLAFGGHADGDENIINVAMRECIEESGIENIDIISTDFFDVDVHSIPTNEQKNENAHNHFDVTFLFQTQDSTQFVISNESNDLKWFSIEELKALNLGGRFPRMIQKWEKILESKAA